MNSLMVPEESQITHEPSVMEILSQAVLSGNVGVDVIERLTKLQREQIEYQAKTEFNDAMQRVQKRMRPIEADLYNPQTKSKFASYKQLDKVMRPIYSSEGFALSFNTGDCPIPDHIRVLCDVTRGGYVKPYQIDIPNDGKGAKGGDVMTKTHATGAAASYGMRYLLKMIFNIAVGEDDDDGNCVGSEVEASRGKLLNGMKLAQSEDELTSLYRAGIKDALHAKDYAGIKMFDQARDKRRRELAGEID